MRGGTSRGAFLHAADLPDDPAQRDRVVLAIYGSPDRRQIDGIGGADPLTSKVAIVSRSEHPDADVDYLFGQVLIEEPVVDYGGICGNMLAGVGPFAIDEGLVEPSEPVTRVRIRNVNTGRLIVAEVPVTGGRARATGEAAIAGVTGQGAGIVLDFSATGATLGRGLLPTGQPREQLDAGGLEVAVSIVDAGAPAVFVAARELGLGGRAFLAEPLPVDVVERLGAIRAAAAERLGLVSDRARADTETPAVPKVYAVHAPADFVDALGREMRAIDVTLAGRGLSMGRPHGAYATTVAVATATATRLPGTLVAEHASAPAAGEPDVRIAHPGGVMRVEIDVELEGGEARLRRAGIERTARRIMAGLVYVAVDAC
jgi:2-methylaconitate cis-trans-isomerase PrpF